MSKFKNKIAVITGAAKGIGRGIAEKCAELGCKIVIADIDATELAKVKVYLESKGVAVLAVTTDVTEESAVHELAQTTFEIFGTPHLLFNNAGASGYIGPVWKLAADKIKRVMDLNFMSVVYGIQAFVPKMLELQEPANIINTASMAGFYAFPYFSTYIISKHAVMALSECLFHDLKRQNPYLKVSVLCPGGINTEILNASSKFSDTESDAAIHDIYDVKDMRFITNFARMVKKGITPKAAADIIFQAIDQGKFYIFTHPELKEIIKKRYAAIEAEADPALLDLYD